jgi:hypothetical protein
LEQQKQEWHSKKSIHSRLIGEPSLVSVQWIFFAAWCSLDRQFVVVVG